MSFSLSVVHFCCREHIVPVACRIIYHRLTVMVVVVVVIVVIVVILA